AEFGTRPACRGAAADHQKVVGIQLVGPDPVQIDVFAVFGLAPVDEQHRTAPAVARSLGVEVTQEIARSVAGDLSAERGPLAAELVVDPGQLGVVVSGGEPDPLIGAERAPGHDRDEDRGGDAGLEPQPGPVADEEDAEQGSGQNAGRERRQYFGVDPRRAEMDDAEGTDNTPGEVADERDTGALGQAHRGEDGPQHKEQDTYRQRLDQAREFG